MSTYNFPLIFRSLLPLMGEINDKSLFLKLKTHFKLSEGSVYEEAIYLSSSLEIQASNDTMKTIEIGDFYPDLVSAAEQD